MSNTVINHVQNDINDDHINNVAITTKIDTNHFSEFELNSICKTIERMDKSNHIMVLKILNDNNVILNENANGNQINITEVPSNIIELLISFIEYYKNQNQVLLKIEKEQSELKETYYT